MSTLHDAMSHAVLGWVKPELDDTLRQARNEIEAYVDEPSDGSRMRFCAGYLHQVQGTLRMVELYAPAMVAEELELLAQALQAGTVADRDEACATLMRGVVLLPDYLERLQGGHRDIPIVLLPLLNDIRAARGESGLSESVLFAPDFSRPLPNPVGTADAGVPAQAHRDALGAAQADLDAALQAWPEDGVPASPSALADTTTALFEHAGDEAARRLLWVLSSTAAALRDGALQPSPGLRQAFAGAARWLRQASDAVASGSGQVSSTQEPTRQLLYHVAQGDAPHPALDALREAFDLASATPSEAELDHARGSISGRNKALLDTVGAAVKEEVLRVKDALDLHLRTGGDVMALQPQVDALGGVGDTLGMMGLGVARAVVLQQRDALRTIVDGTTAAGEHALLDIAGALLYVDASLDDQVARLGAVAASQSDDPGVIEAQRTVEVLAHEAIANFAAAREHFVAFIETNWEHARLADVPRLLGDVSGALRMLEIPDAADYVEGVRRYVDRELIVRRRVPGGQQLDTLADAMASLEYYLEALRERRPNRGDILDITRTSLENLHYWPLPDERSGAESDGAAYSDAAALAGPAVAAPVEVLSELQLPEIDGFAALDDASAALSADSDLLAAELEADGLRLETFDDGLGDSADRTSVVTFEGVDIDRGVDDLAPVSTADPVALDGFAGAALDATETLITPFTLDDDAAAGLDGDAVSIDASELVFDTSDLDFAPEDMGLGDLDLASAASDHDAAGTTQVIDDSADATQDDVLPDAADLDAAGADAADAGTADAGTAASDDLLVFDEPAAVASTDDGEPLALLADEALSDATPHAAAPVRAGIPGGFDTNSGDIDDDIREVFLEEFDEEIVNLNQLLPVWVARPDHLEHLRPIRRVFHTLKGSGRLVGARALGEFSWHIENMLNRVLDGSRTPTPAVTALLGQANAVLPALNTALRDDSDIFVDLHAMQAIAERVAAGEEAFYSEGSNDASAGAPSERDEGVQDVVAVIDTAPGVLPRLAGAEDGTPASVDSVLREILEAEIATHMETVGQWLAASEATPQPVTETLLRSVHTMNGAFAMTDVPEITRVTHPAEGYLKRSLSAAITPSPEGVAALSAMADAVRRSIAALQSPSPRIPSFTELAERLSSLRDALPEARVVQTIDLFDEPDADDAMAGDTVGDADTRAEEVAGAHELTGIHDLSAYLGDGTGGPLREDGASTAPVAPPEASFETADTVAAGLPDDLELTADEPLEAESAPLATDDAVLQEAPADVEAGASDEVHADTTAFTAEASDAADAAWSGTHVDEDAPVAWADAGLADSGETHQDAAMQATPDEFATLPALSAEELDAQETAEIEAMLAADRAAEADAAEAAAAIAVTERALADHAAAEQAAAEQAAAEQAAAEHAAAEQAAAEQAAAEQAAAEQAAAEQAAAEYAAAEQAAVGQAAEEQAAAEQAAAEAAQRAAAEADAAATAAAEALARELADAAAQDAPIPEVSAAPMDDAAAGDNAAAANDDDTSADAAASANARASADAPEADEPAVPPLPLELEGLDLELLDIFVEEGNDLLDHADNLLNDLRTSPGERELVIGLQRDLHTLKGGARMAGIPAIGDLGHVIESLLEAVAANRTELGREGVQLLERGFDRLHGQLASVAARQVVTAADDLIAEVEARVQGNIGKTSLDAEDEARATAIPAMPAPRLASPAALTPASGDGDPDKIAPAPLTAPLVGDETVEEETSQRTPQEQVRVRADLLDRLVNHAGEVAIYRSRLEQQLGAFRGAMGELDRTNARLRDQLRRLDLETEAQIVARYQREQDQAEPVFDPLELDRFSTLQQLSRALGESAADLTGLQGVLDDLARQYDTLLQQQSRVSSELQDGLMRARMVPFDGLVPRLRRVVRQAETDTGKQVRLQLDGTHGELDRNVLDRMTAPLEHILRNSIAHGVELPADRVKAGKPEEGTIRLQLRREGSEIVLQVSDDGAGLDRTAIRRRAEERGLIAAEALLSDADLDTLIMESGFSTASSVSQLAGRGVGMDIVRNEVRQLGGAVEIESTRGKGARFTLRLPQTLAVTQAVFVEIGETTFAVPVASVSGVGRIARERFESGNGIYTYGGEEYALHDLGALVGQPPARAEGQPQVPLLLVRAGELRAAVAIDQVVGNREIVVKPVGLQIASIPGIYGATITGDGRVVVILDVAPLVRRHLAQPVRPAPEAPAADVRRVPLVMVVDDSLTMRKVTGRVLERHNFEVLTARDGLEALERMEETVPDLMLLDIEMPRMDGYELATAMKAQPRLKDVPIVMITSRSGDKHRQRAFDLGVNRYMGKPYQELDLMRNVYDLLGIARVRD